MVRASRSTGEAPRMLDGFSQSITAPGQGWIWVCQELRLAEVQKQFQRSQASNCPGLWYRAA